MIKKIFLFLLLFICQEVEGYTVYHSKYKYDLAICAISRGEAPYLKEWIEFHKLVGVEHFYIYCHNDLANYEKVLLPYIRTGEVDLFQTKPLENNLANTDPLKEFNAIQYQCYNDLMQRVKKDVKWVAVIDTDEYLFSPVTNNIRDILRNLEKTPKIGGVSVNWQMFGSSDVKKIPKGKLMIEILTRCAPSKATANNKVKTIVRPKDVTYYANPHYPHYYKKVIQVNTDGVPFRGAESPYVVVDQLRINHYWTRDENYFWKEKIKRQREWGRPISDEQALGILEEYNKNQDEEILRFVPALRKKLGLKP